MSSAQHTLSKDEPALQRLRALLLHIRGQLAAMLRRRPRAQQVLAQAARRRAREGVPGGAGALHVREPISEREVQRPTITGSQDARTPFVWWL